jgi:hypothetical protein
MKVTCFMPYLFHNIVPLFLATCPCSGSRCSLRRRRQLDRKIHGSTEDCSDSKGSHRHLLNLNIIDTTATLSIPLKSHKITRWAVLGILPSIALDLPPGALNWLGWVFILSPRRKWLHLSRCLTAPLSPSSGRATVPLDLSGTYNTVLKMQRYSHTWVPFQRLI